MFVCTFEKVSGEYRDIGNSNFTMDICAMFSGKSINWDLSRILGKFLKINENA